MKIRNGFVSNSSSSSFILGIAKIKDKQKFDNWFSKIDSRFLRYISIRTVGELESLHDACYFNADLKIENEEVKLHNFCKEVSIPVKNLTPYDLLFMVATCNDEGDDSFVNPCGDLNWEIDTSDLSENERKVYEGMIKENGFDLINSIFGVGRNG